MAEEERPQKKRGRLEASTVEAASANPQEQASSAYANQSASPQPWQMHVPVMAASEGEDDEMEGLLYIYYVRKFCRWASHD
jgi:hypothetical protein